jgi:hypothetical protein
MHNDVPIELALTKMRELLELVTRSDPERRDAVLGALQAILQTLVNLDSGSAAVVLATDFKGSMGVYTLNANEETVVALAQTVLAQLQHIQLDNIPAEDMGAMQ